MAEPLISVIVPVYKVEKYLTKCVDSILNQTYRNLEVILVDDGSPDRCGAICDTYAEKDSRVQVIHKPNGGPSDARNAGLKVVKGDYVTFIDSDDWIAPDLYQKILAHVPFEMAIYGCTFVTENGEEIRTIKAAECSKMVEIGTSGEKIKELSNSSLLGYACNKVYRTELVKGMKYGQVELREDLLFNLSAIKRTQEIFVSSQCGYFYRQRQDSLLHGRYCGNVPNLQNVLFQMTQIHPSLPAQIEREISDKMIKTYFIDMIEKFIWNNAKLEKREKRQEIKRSFSYPFVRRTLKIIGEKNKLYFLFALCYKLCAPGLFYTILKGIWHSE